MNRAFVVVLLMLGTMLSLPIISQSAHGLFTGLVCIAPTNSTQCPAPYTVGNVAVGSKFTIGVFIQNSEAMGGFDIYVAVNTTFLTATGANLGTLIASPSSTIICVNGVSVSGACTTGSANGPGVVEVGTSESSGSNECGGISPCSGLAFTINYTVVGKTASTPFTYPSAAACSTGTSVGANVCVSVADNLGTILPETDQTGSFTSLDPTANFFATPRRGPSPLTVAFDASISSPTPGHAITAYTWTFGDGNVTTLTGPTLANTVSHIYYTVGVFNPSLQTTDTSLNSSTITDTLTITVLKNNFTISAAPIPPTQPIVLQPGRNRNASITLTSMNGTTGIITLSNNGTNPSIGLTANWTSTSIFLGTAVPAAVPLRLTASATATSGTYHVNITGTFTFSTSHLTQTTIRGTAFLTVQIVGFNYRLTNSGAIDVPRGSSATTKITVTLIGSIPAKPVTLTNSTALPPGVTFSFSPAVVIPTYSGNFSTLTIFTTLSTPDSSSATHFGVTGAPPPLAAANATVVDVFVSDFSISGTSLSVPQGGNGNTPVLFAPGAGFTANITATVKPASNNIVATIIPANPSVSVASGSNATTLYVIVKLGTAPGVYAVTVTGAVGPLTHSININVTVPVPDFTVTSAPSSLFITAGNSGTSAITLIGVSGFTGTITLSTNSPPAGVTLTFSSTSVTITSSSGPLGSTLTISTIATTTAGTYALNITATSGSLIHFTIVSVTVVAAQSSVSLAGATVSTQSVTSGQKVDMTVSISDTGAAPVNITITMDVYAGTGSNITVAQRTVTLTPGLSAQMFTLTWDTTTWTSGNYRVYARVIGSQSSAVNQAMSAGTVALTGTTSSGGGSSTTLSVLPWATTGIFAVLAAAFAVLFFRRRTSTGPKASA